MGELGVVALQVRSIDSRMRGKSHHIPGPLVRSFGCRTLKTAVGFAVRPLGGWSEETADAAVAERGGAIGSNLELYTVHD